jgi:hypothetical protein
MKLIDDMRALAAGETSMFAAQLLKEDIARLERLEQLAMSEPDAARYRNKAMLLSWTPGDLRTFELDPELGAFLTVVHDAVAANSTARDAEIVAAWRAFNKRRMDLLVGCLSRPRID